MAETTYIVLRRDGSGWREDGEYNALSAIAAVRAAAAYRAEVAEADEAMGPAGTYVAVPARSWKPVQVSAVQTTVLKLEDATSKPPEPKAVA